MVTYNYNQLDETTTTTNKRNNALKKVRESVGGKSPRSEFQSQLVAEKMRNKNARSIEHAPKDDNRRKKRKAVKSIKRKKVANKEKKHGYESTDSTNTVPKSVEVRKKRNGQKKSKSFTTSPSNHTSSISSFTKQQNDSSPSQESIHMQEIKRLEATIKKLKKGKQGSAGKKNKDPIVSKHFEWYVKWIVKETIYPKVKFISSAAMLEDTSKDSSIGNFFLKKYKEFQHNNKYGSTQEMTDDEIWENSKDLLATTINQKRGTIQTGIKKAWIGTYINELIESYIMHLNKMLLLKKLRPVS